MPDAFVKAPGDVCDLEFEFDDVLVGSEVLASVVSVTISPSGVTTEGSATINTGDDSKSAIQQVSGGEPDTTYTITVAVTTDTGSPNAHQYTRRFTLEVKHL